MCGIAGLISRTRSVSSALAESLDRELAHRGPDDRGVYTSPDGLALFVHRRLSLIDLSAKGHQPMTTPDGRHWLVYNGEFYNFGAVRQELEGRGERFASGSDTEVLLRLLACDGAAALARVRGMFALAWWDSAARTLLLARDRYGIKPLYVAERGGCIAFASELRALIDSGIVPREVNAAGVLAYLRWGSVPSPLTWIDGVTALRPGTWQRWGVDGRLDHGAFADVRSTWVTNGGASIDHGDLRARVRSALDESVRAHLIADVPVGVFLSGGVDSSALVALARRHVADLRTYTVVVDEAEFDEAAAAARTAQHFKTHHQTLRVEGADVRRDWASIVTHLDQPTSDGINTYYVSRAVASTGVKAVLSGIGGDELFGGYPSFRRLPMAERIAGAAGLALPLVARLARAGRARPYVARVQHLAQSAGHRAEMYRALRGLLMPGELDAVRGDRLADANLDATVATLEGETLAPVGCERVEAATARLETVQYLRSQLLRDVDVMSMAHGLEVRVPFIDHELAAAVWPALGAHPSLLAHKQLLTSALPWPLPSAVTTQAKRGFTLPFARWIHGPLSDLVRSGLRDLAADGWIAAGVPDALWRQLQQRRVHWSRPWALGVLGRFLRDA